MKRNARSRNDWSRVRFGDVVLNSTVVSRDPEGEGFTRYIIGKHIDENRPRVESWGDVGDPDFGPRIRTIFLPGDIICTTRGPHLKVATVDFRGLGAHTNFVLRTRNPEVLLQPYLEALARSDSFQQHLAKHFRGSVNLFVNWSDAALYEFDLPPIEEQCRICEATNRSNELIEAAQQNAQASHRLFLAALRDLLPPSEPTCRMVPLGEACRVGTGGTPSRARQDFWNGTIPWVKTGEVNYRTISATEEHITTEGLNSSAAKVYPKGSIVMALFGQGPTLGRVARLGIDASTNQACAVIQSNDPIALELIFYWLWSQYRVIRSLARGATQPNLNVAIVKSIPVPVASAATARRILEPLRVLEQSVADSKAYLGRTEDVSKQLTSQLL